MPGWARKTGGAWYYYIYNAHGDVIGVVNESGTVVNNYTYDAWGNIVSQTEGISNPIKYAGEYYDDELGMYYLRARYYDPSIGRFTSKDPIESEMNRYAYCGNNPVNRVDPSGLNWLSDKIRDMFNTQLDAEMAKTKSMNENQQEMQRDFWRMGSEKFLRNKKGYLTSAWMLEHSLQNTPTDEWRGNDSRIAYLINHDSAYLSKLDTAIGAAKNNKISQTLYVYFSTGDLYYSIHASTIYVEGYKQDNGKWLIHSTMTDIYDFTVIQSCMNSNGEFSKDIGLGTVANDAAVVSQLLGAINPYKITVDFYTTR